MTVNESNLVFNENDNCSQLIKSISKTKASQLVRSDDSESQDSALSPGYNTSYPGHRTENFIFQPPIR